MRYWERAAGTYARRASREEPIDGAMRIKRKGEQLFFTKKPTTGIEKKRLPD